MGEIKNPARTMRRAGPIALGGIAILYVLIQVAYFAAVPREQILASTQVGQEKMHRHVHGDSPSILLARSSLPSSSPTSSASAPPGRCRSSSR